MRRPFTRITLPLTSMSFLNQAGRIVVALVGPAIALEFGLSASGLGALAAVFFAAYALAQLPIGLAMDLYSARRMQVALGLVYSARRMQVALGLVAALGFALCAMAPDPGWLAVGRFVSGVGIAGALIAVMKAHVQWYRPERMAVVTGAAVLLGAAGALCATVPVQRLLPLLGWRGAFLLLALLACLSALWIHLSLPRAPPPGAASPPPRRRLAEEVAEFGRIVAHPQFTRFTPAIALATALVFTYQGLWAGPWLRDVAGLDDAARAAVLFSYVLGMMAGHLGSGYAASAIQARGGEPMLVPLAGVAGMALLQAALLAGPRDPVSLHALWFAFAAFGSCGPVAYALLAQRFPASLTGRVSTAMNGSMLALVFLLQAGIGLILDLWPRTATGGWDPAGYAWAMGLTLALQAVSVLWLAAAPRLLRGSRTAAA